MQAGADLTGDLGHPALHAGVHVLVGGLEHRAAGGQLGRHPIESGQEDLGVFVREDPGGRQAPHVGAGAGHVVRRQSLVEREAHGVRQ
jgi:hypothetical protein